MNPVHDPATYVVGRTYRIRFVCADGNFGGEIEDVLVEVKTYEGLVEYGPPKRFETMVGALRFERSEIGPPDGVQITEVTL